MRKRLIRRAIAGVSRRMERPELLAAFYPGARQELREQIALRAILAAALPGDGVYVDAGTNRGQVLGQAVTVAPGARHFAFEPIPALAAEIERSFPAVECRRLALGAQPGQAEFCHFRTFDGWSGLRRNPEISDERGHPEYITVTVSTLDIELADVSPSVVKIDVEGAELEVLEGGRDLLLRARPVIIFEHVASSAALYGAPPGAPWDLLSELGYEIFSVTGEGPLTRARFVEGTTVVNWLARAARSGAN
jgi:FkbM family methyltransferase